MLTDTLDKNAYYSLTNKNAITIQDEMLSVEPETLKDIGFHETSHLVDYLGDTQISEGEIKKFWDNKTYDRKTSTFFTEINESNFSQGSHSGGHSQDNPAELFASYVVSLRHPKWESRIEQQTADFKRDYLELTNATIRDLESSKQIPEEAPVFKELYDKKEYLEQIVKKLPNEILPEKKIDFSGLTLPKFEFK